jgi:hypothetical protein
MQRLFIVLLALFSSPCYGQDSFDFEAILSKAQLGQNERLRVSFEMNKDGDFFEAPTFEGFEVLMGPSQSLSSSFINGKRSFSKSYTYVLRPKQQGQLRIGSAKITYEGNVYSTEPKTVLVTESVANPNAPKTAQDIADESLYLVATLSNDSPYVNQGVLVTYTLYFSPRVYVNNFVPVESPAYKNFWSQDLPIKEYETRRETFRNQTFNAVDLKKVVLYPQKSGALELDPFALELYVQIPTGRRDFFGDPIMRSATKTVRAGDISLTVEALPLVGKPENYSGAVGNFSFEVIPSRNVLEANESTQIDVSVAGEGNLKLLKLPEIRLPAALETYDPEYTDAVSVDEKGMRGSVRNSYTVVPRYSGNYPVPAIEFTYFDPITKRYKSLVSPEFELTVTGTAAATDGGNASNTSTSVTSAAPLAINTDFVPNAYQSEFSKITQSNPLSRWWYWLLVFIALMVGLLNKFIIEKLVKGTSSSRTKNSKSLPRLIRSRIRQLEKQASNSDPEFYTGAPVALFMALEGITSQDLSTLSKQDRIALLRSKNLEETSITRVNKLIDRFATAKYSGLQQIDYLSDFNELRSLIEDLN